MGPSKGNPPLSTSPDRHWSPSCLCRQEHRTSRSCLVRNAGTHGGIGRVRESVVTIRCKPRYAAHVIAQLRTVQRTSQCSNYRFYSPVNYSKPITLCVPGDAVGTLSLGRHHTNGTVVDCKDNCMICRNAMPPYVSHERIRPLQMAVDFTWKFGR
jgi:hypothetical protein